MSTSDLEDASEGSVTQFEISDASPDDLSSIDDPLLGKDGDDSNEWSPHNSFLADSPYFSAFVENDVKSLTTLVTTLRDISARTKTFSKCGALMAESTRRLAYSCRLRRDNDFSNNDDNMTHAEKAAKEKELVNERRRALGHEMADLLELLGEVLEEIAAAQLNMVNVFDSTLGMSLEAFAGTEQMTVNMLKQEAEQTTESSENMFFKYINGKHAGGNAGLFAADGDAPPGSSKSAQSTQKQASQMISSRIKQWRKGSSGENQKKNHPERGVMRTSSGSNAGGGEESSQLAMAATAANLRLTLEQIRLGQATAELKRFQLLKHLVGIKHRRNFELCEGALASLHGMRTYFHQAFDVVQALGPRMAKIQTKENEMKDHHQKKIMPVWNERENCIIRTLDTMHEGLADASFVAAAVANGDSSLVDQQSLALDKIEDQTRIWELPQVLAQSSRYRRESPPGILVEGWLYKKSSARMSLQPWQRRWFMMNKDAIYYYRSSAEIRKNASGDDNECMHTSQRVKVCDIVLSTIRELPDDGNTRFCFEIITPNQKPLLLQARGPKDLRMWIDGIRANVENQLVHGDPHSDQLNKGIGKKNIIRESSNGSGKDGDLPPGLSDRVRSANNDGAVRDSKEDASGKDASHASLGGNTKAPPNPLVEQIMKANPTCADCNAPSPDWASLNLGALVCINCSGIHRSLGVHVSKVRSLTLDSLSDGESRALLAIGNEKVNAIWEKGLALQKGWKKPDSQADRKTRENYIKSKYLWKGFLEYNDSDGRTVAEREETFSRALYEAAKECDVLGIAKALALGGSVDWTNSEENGKTALHACVEKKRSEEDNIWQAIECAELILQNGAKMDATDDGSLHVYDFADGNSEKEMLNFLWNKLTEPERRDRLGIQLYKAAKSGDLEGLSEALSRGVSVDWVNEEDGKTPLHVAVLAQRPQPDDEKWNAIGCVKLLLEKGANEEALDREGHNTLDCALVGGAEREMIEFLSAQLN